MPMRGVDLNALTSKLVKLELTSQLSAEQVGYLFQVFDAKSDTVGLESFLAKATAIQTLLGAVMNDATMALVEQNRAAVAAEREKAQILVGQALLDGGSKPAGGSGAKAAQVLSAPGAEAKAEEHHEVPLPPALAAWEPIGKTAAVKEAAAGIKQLEAAFAREPSGEAAEVLCSKTEDVEAALRSAIDQRVAEDKIAARCDAVIEAGGEAFTAGYDGVYKSIEVTEAEGMEGAARRAERPAAGRAGRAWRRQSPADQDRPDGGVRGRGRRAAARHGGYRARRRRVRRREGRAAAAEGDAAHAREGAAAAGRVAGAVRHGVRLRARHAHRQLGGAARHACARLPRRRGRRPRAELTPSRARDLRAVQGALP